MFIQERINMLIDVFHKSQPDKSEQEKERILQAEIFIENLSDKVKKLIENYIDSLTHRFALEESFLYLNGFMDGVMQVKGRCTLQRSCQFTADGNADCLRICGQATSFLGGCQ